MTNTLDKYLQTVAHELRDLPRHKREAELREMRQHLEAIIARLCEGGLSEAEATEAAIAQFGAARRVGRELKRAGEGREPWPRVVLAPLCGISSFAVLALLSCIVDIPLQDALESLGVKGWMFEVPEFVLLGLISMASGAVASRISPRSGGRTMLWFPIAALLSAVPLGMFPREVLEDSHVLLDAFAAPLAFYCTGIFLGSRWANGLLWPHKPQQVGPTKIA